MLSRSLLVLSITLFCVPAPAEILKWVDEQGNVHFGDKVPDKYKTKSKTVDVEISNVVKTVKRKPIKPKRDPAQYLPEYMRENEALRQRLEKKRKRNAVDSKRLHTDPEYRKKWLDSHEPAAEPEWSKQRKAQYKKDQPCRFSDPHRGKEKKLREICKDIYFRGPPPDPIN